MVLSMIISLYHTANSFHLFSFLFCCSLFSFLFFVSFPYNLYTFCCAEVPFFVAQSLGNFATFVGFFLSCLFETFRQTLQAPTASFMAPSVKFGKLFFSNFVHICIAVSSKKKKKKKKKEKKHKGFLRVFSQPWSCSWLCLKHNIWRFF
jgi:hypothetical protein